MMLINLLCNSKFFSSSYNHNLTCTAYAYKDLTVGEDNAFMYKCHWLFMCSIIFRMIKSCSLTSLKRIRMIGVTWIWIELEPNMATLKFNYFLWITKSSNSELQYKSDAWNIWIRQDIIWHIHVVYFFVVVFPHKLL